MRLVAPQSLQAVHKAIQESAFLMIYEREADAGIPIDLGGIELPNEE